MEKKDIKEYEKKIKDLEEKIKEFSVKDEICDWITYDNKQCKRHSVACHGDYKFCKLHKKMLNDYKINNDSEELCESYKKVKIIPRSYKHIKYFMRDIDNEETIVNICFPGGCTEEADISNDEYILLLSDDSKYYYKYERGDLKAKDLRLLLKKYCKNNGKINIDGVIYCKDCYKNIKNSPKLHLIK